MAQTTSSRAKGIIINTLNGDSNVAFFKQLAAAGRARELRPGGLARATARFATPITPWCPEGF